MSVATLQQVHYKFYDDDDDDETQNYRRSHSSTIRLAIISASRALFSISIFSSSVWQHIDKNAPLRSYNSTAGISK